MKIKDIMSKKVVSVGPGESIESVIEELSRKNITGMPVVSKRKLVGIVTQSDIIKNIDIFSRINMESDISAINKMLRGRDISKDEIRKICRKKVRGIMNKNVVTIGIENDLYEAAKAINENGIDRLPVIHKGKLVGIVTKKDIIKAIERMES
ncbi:MAG: CBS domain-containing protein [Candidatus Aenigmarchaeota archaeon]|nr:CBS domain-containing protein [Candidatus Aenigmarchaeota archaeon]MDI6722208.1 CBS domain-containing protein [Candidatus Aenigmarchaeota archaeon]